MKSLNQFLEAKHSFMVNGPVNTVLNNKYKDKFVDLGLSVDWAKCNLGAKEETDPGHYYMWGSTKPNDNDKCCWENAPFNNRKKYAEDYFNKIKDKVCPDGILTPEYDAATVELGKEYCMPTFDKCIELLSNTKQEWVENYNNTDVNGFKFINKKDDSKYIFIPVTDFRVEDILSRQKDDSILWSSSLSDDNFGAWRLYLNKLGSCVYSCSRYYGFTIRPVYNGKKK